MIVEVGIAIQASKQAIWAAITDIEHAADIVSGIQKIEILEKPANGVVGLKWRETRMMSDKPATVTKWITEAVENQYYKTRAEDMGFAFLTTKKITEANGQITLSESHESNPQTFVAKLMLIPMRLFFKGTIAKAVMQDLQDIKAAVERGQAR